MDGRALLAWNLRRIRAERGISQEKLAHETEIDRAYLSELERQDGNATVDLLQKLAVALDVPIWQFFRQPEPGAKRPAILPAGRPPVRKKRTR